MTEAPLVLVVDDNEQNLKLAGDVLRLAGFRTIAAVSGAEAIALAERHLPDVVLMDLGLPDMSGADAARVLREASPTAAIPIVAVSASRIADEEWLLAAGFAGYIEKPIDVRGFAAEVQRYASRSHPA